MRRREFIKIIVGSTATVWPLVVCAQQPKMPVIGFMHVLSSENVPQLVPAFKQGLKEQGFVEGQNVAIEYRWAQGQFGRLPKLAADLVKHHVAVIAAVGGEPTPHIAEAATHTIPIVFTANGDPVKSGLVASLNRPGGNATGITIFGGAAAGKRLQLIHDLLPQAAIVYLMNPSNSTGDAELRTAQTAARSLEIKVQVLKASTQREIDKAFETMAQQRVGALLVASDTYFYFRRNQIVLLAKRYGIPAIYYLPAFARAGGTDMFRLVGVYVGRILKGEKPADLPVVQSSKYELVINLRTAKALGLTFPPTLLARADEVIE
jgi:putative ABC transport system substrate-binding protein